MGGETSDGRSTATPPTAVQVPTREQLRAKWTCDCELLGLVRPKVAGSHKAAAVLCSRRRERTGSDDTKARVGQTLQVLAHGIRADLDPSSLPPSVHKLWLALGKPRVTWALIHKARQVKNPAWATASEDQLRDRSIGKTILVPAPYETYGIRHRTVRGWWGEWQGKNPKPMDFWIRDETRGVWIPSNYEDCMKYATGEK